MRAFVLILFIIAAVPVQTARKADSLGRARIAEYYNAGDREGVLDACRGLVQTHREQGNEKELFNAYATWLDQLEVMGRFGEAMDVLEQMSADAQGSDIGAAVTEFCFGQFYLGNRQPAEAEPHYRRAFNQLQALGENNRAMRAGFNLQAVAMNLNRLDEGLAMNDTTARYRLDLAGFQQDNEDYEQAVKSESGQTVSEFITHFRLRYAAGLLSDNPGLSVLEIGEVAGFSSRNTMHRQFSDHFGMSPLEYRRASRAKA